jgi:two-component system nitrate/nitrite response regulator NarL
MHTEPLVSPLRVLVAGADPLVRRGLSQLLSEREAFEVLGPVGLGGGLASAIQLHRPDAVLVDPGPEIEPGAFETVGGVPVLVLATDADHAARALTMGARGALARDTEAGRLGPALAAVERGLLVLDDRFAELLRRPAPAEGDFTLTARELEVLTLLAEGLSNREIAERLGFSAHTAKFHVNAVLGKLDATTRTEAVARAVRHGVLRL